MAVAVATAELAPHEAADEPQWSLFSWAEFLADTPEEPKPRRRRHEAPTLSLFEWALDREREDVLAEAAG